MQCFSKSCLPRAVLCTCKNSNFKNIGNSRSSRALLIVVITASILLLLDSKHRMGKKKVRTCPGCSKCRYAQRGCRRCVDNFVTYSEERRNKLTAMQKELATADGRRRNHHHHRDHLAEPKVTTTNTKKKKKKNVISIRTADEDVVTKKNKMIIDDDDKFLRTTTTIIKKDDCSNAQKKRARTPVVVTPRAETMIEKNNGTMKMMDERESAEAEKTKKSSDEIDRATNRKEEEEEEEETPEKRKYVDYEEDDEEEEPPSTLKRALQNSLFFGLGTYEDENEDEKEKKTKTPTKMLHKPAISPATLRTRNASVWANEEPTASLNKNDNKEVNNNYQEGNAKRLKFENDATKAKLSFENDSFDFLAQVPEQETNPFDLVLTSLNLSPSKVVPTTSTKHHGHSQNAAAAASVQPPPPKYNIAINKGKIELDVANKRPTTKEETVQLFKKMQEMQAKLALERERLEKYY